MVLCFEMSTRGQHGEAYGSGIYGSGMSNEFLNQGDTSTTTRFSAMLETRTGNPPHPSTLNIPCRACCMNLDRCVSSNLSPSLFQKKSVSRLLKNSTDRHDKIVHKTASKMLMCRDAQFSDVAVSQMRKSVPTCLDPNCFPQWHLQIPREHE